MNPSIGREERDELWSALPGIQVAVMSLLSTCIDRLGRGFVSLAQESLEQTARMLGSFYRIPAVRHIAYTLMRKLLTLCGPTMAKISVDGTLDLVIRCVCRDLQATSGHLRRPQNVTATLQNGTKTKSANHNTDAFLSTAANKPGGSNEDTIRPSFSAGHVRAASALLATLHNSVPQQHVSSAARGKMLQAAILAGCKEAQLASVLNPSRGASGGSRSQVILPYLMRQFPDDAGVELLRFNFRPMGTGRRGDFGEFDNEDAGEDDEDTAMTNDTSAKVSVASAFGTVPEVHSNGTTTIAADAEMEDQPMFGTIVPASQGVPASGATESPFLMQATSSTTTTTTKTVLKRKNDADGEGEDSSPPKRVEVESGNVAVVEAVPQRPAPRAKTEASLPADDGDDSSDDESVHLNMELDSDDDAEE